MDKWITSDIKPERAEDDPCCTVYVIVTDGSRIGFGYYDYDLNWWSCVFVGCSPENSTKITHWVPMIELPKD